jgi:uncharacterized protein (DUF1501 family)
MLPMGMAPFMLGGLPLRTMARSLMTSSFSCDDINDRVLVLIQLHGGNDGLNTFIPLDQYSLYRNLRPNIGVKDTGLRQYVTLDSTLPSEQQLGLHPDLMDLKHLYDEGKARIIQNVAYDHINGSHFRGSDIWLSGLDPSTIGEQPESGWWGRYLDHRFPDYPTAYPNSDLPDPPGLEFGSHIISLGFHRQMGIPMGLTLANDPTDFANAVLGSGSTLPSQFPPTDHGRELQYLVEMERSTNLYADRLTNVYNAGANTVGVTYPETYHTYATRNYRNQLAPQLKTIARLLSGGITTKIFLARLGGFDTHEGQGLPDKPSFGSHGALLYHLSSAMRAFQEDLKGLGLEDRVMTVTFSEFGRTVGENSTYGTDHGSSAPMMAFGKGIHPGVSGVNADLSNLQRNRLVGFDTDYRQVFATVLQDWFGANYGTLDHAEFYEFGSQKIDLVNANYVDPVTSQTVNYVADTACDPTPNLPPPPPPDPDPVHIKEAFEVTFQVGPNPARDQVQLSLTCDRMAPVRIELRDLNGKLLRSQDWRLYGGENQTRLDLQGLSAGTYLLRVLAYPGSGFMEQQLAQEKLLIL